MRYPEGYRTLRTNEGRRLQEFLQPTELEDFDKCEVGDQFVILGNRRTDQGVYEVVDKDEDRNVHVRKLTKTGKVSKAKGSLKCIPKHYFRNEGYSFEVMNRFATGTKEILKEFHRYFNHTKDEWVVSGEARDSQRQRVYDAENKMRKKLGKGQQFETEKEANEWLQILMGMDEFDKLFPDFKYHDLKIKINNRYKNKCVAHYWKREIVVAGNSLSFGLNEVVMAHELAHFTAEDAQHNAPFTTNFVNILRMLNDDLADELQRQYDRHNVEY